MKSLRSTAFAAVTLALSLASASSMAVTADHHEEEAVALNAETIAELVNELADQLEANFVFPDAASDYATMLRAELGEEAYVDMADPAALAEQLTADLQEVHEDRHLAVRAPQPPSEEGQQQRRPRGAFGPDSNAISASGWLDDGIAYIRFEGFPGNEATMAGLRAFLETHRDAETLIIDARTHRGGGLAEMDVLFPAIFAQPTELVVMETRAAVAARRGQTEGTPTLRRLDSPDTVVSFMHHVTPSEVTALSNSKIFLLTSGRTGSAGEHLSLSLKRSGRATLIGETTYGAGHYGGFVPIGHGFTVFIPVGRTYDPDTGKGWEATGVAPNVATNADDALDEALRLAGAKVTAETALARLD